MLLVRHIAQLAHLAQDSHLGRHLHQSEVVEGGFHGCGVGIIGIHDEVVLLRLRQLRAVVGGHIVFQCVVNLFERHVVHVTYRDGSQHVIHVIGANQVGLYLHPF